MSRLTENKPETKPPATFIAFAQRFPDLAATHQAVGHYVDGIGPIDAKHRSLIKIGICIGAGLESALRSHVRKAVAAGATREELEQAILLAMNTCGFPRTVAAWKWTTQYLDEHALEGEGASE